MPIIENVENISENDFNSYTCPLCHGYGKLLGNNINNDTNDIILVECHGCKGAGKIIIQSKL